jgi:hypothetical protein
MQFTGFAPRQCLDFFLLFHRRAEPNPAPPPKAIFPSTVSVTPRGLRFSRFHADLLFQGLHLPAERRLGDAEFLRRFVEAQRFSNGQKRSQMPKFHGASSYAETA